MAERAEPFTAENAAEKGRNGGRKSGESRRKKKALREWAEVLLNSPVTDPKILKKYVGMGVMLPLDEHGKPDVDASKASKLKIKTIDGKLELSHGALVTAAMIKLAESGSGKDAVAAFNALASVTAGGQDHVDTSMTGVVELPAPDVPERPPEEDE